MVVADFGKDTANGDGVQIQISNFTKATEFSNYIDISTWCVHVVKAQAWRQDGVSLLQLARQRSTRKGV